MLSELRSEGLVELQGKVLTILDFERLKELAQYEVNYLHLIRTEQRDGEVGERAADLVPRSHGGIAHEAIATLKHPFDKSKR